MKCNCVPVFSLFTIIAHFNACQNKRGAEVKGVKTIENFFAKAAAQSVPAPTDSVQPDLNHDDQDQFDGADAIVSEK